MVRSYNTPEQNRSLSFMLNNVLPVVTKEMLEQSKALKYKNDPVLWAQEVLGIHLWSKQKEILYAIRDNKRVAVRSCNNGTKTYIVAIATKWFCSVNEPNDTRVTVTAPSFEQIRQGVFHELRVMDDNLSERGYNTTGELFTSKTTLEWRIGEYTVALGRKPPDRDAITAFQGLHRKNVLIVIEEAGGVSREVYQAAERVTTNDGNVKIIAIGNPDYVGSQFFDTFYNNNGIEPHELEGTGLDPNPKDHGLWKCFRISAFDTPNFTDEPFPEELRRYMLSRNYVEDMRTQYGEDHGWYKTSVLGEFPKETEYTFFSSKQINKGYETEITDLSAPEVLAVDVARFGDDLTVVYSNKGGRIRYVDSWQGESAPETVKRVADIAKERMASVVIVDEAGLGGAYLDYLVEELPSSCHVIGYNGSRGTPDKRKWFNYKSASYDLFRQALEEGKIDLEPNDWFNPDETVEIDYPGSVLRKQMLKTMFSITKSDQLVMESKVSLKSRGEKSPDHLDAVVMAYSINLLDYVIEDNKGVERVNLDDDFFGEIDWMVAIPW